MESSARHGGTSLSKKPWFPPATFQLRVRCLSSLAVVHPPLSANGGPLTILIRDRSGSLLWSSPEFPPSSPVIQEIPEGAIHYPNESFIVWLLCSEVLLKEWSVLSLRSLPTHGPLLAAETTTQGDGPCLLLGIRGSPLYLSLPSPQNAEVRRINSFPTAYSVPSYSLSLLLKYRRHHRALMQREADNRNLKQELADQGLEPNNDRITDPDSSLSLHQRIFTSNPSKKSPFQRKSELLLASRIEYLRIQLDLLRAEKERLCARNASVSKDISRLAEDILCKKEVIRRLARDTESLKVSLGSWSGECGRSLRDFEALDGHVKGTRLRLLRAIQDLFPICTEGDVPTIRWVSLPNLAGLSRPFLKQESLNAVSIVLGWIAHIVLLMSRCLDVPLRYPIHPAGALFAMRGDVCKIQEDFPLAARPADLNRCEYGIYLLNKNVCYLRWSVGLPPGDARKILHNVMDLYNLGVKNKSLNSDVDLEGLANIQRPSRPPWMSNNNSHTHPS